MMEMTLATSGFGMPRDGDLFIGSIRERCESYIDAGIWAGIDRPQLRIWMNQFSEGPERYFAACILDSLLYRTTPQTVALLEQLFQRSLPDLARKNELMPGKEDLWLECLMCDSSSGDPGIRIVPVVKDNDRPTKSALLIARMYKQHLRIDERFVIWHWDIPKARQSGASAFLFVDDFLGTGSQFMRFTSRFEIPSTLAGAIAIYAPFVAHDAGIKKLTDEAKWLHICWAERLSASYNLFSESSLVFNDGANSPEAAKEFYLEILHRKQLQIDKIYIYGYGGLALTYVFEHATPNNNIPLLWHKDNYWEPLFRR